MINKKLNEIAINDFFDLIENGVTESKTLEYKEKLPDKTSDSRKEFLADVSSFANSEGGDIIFGIKENDGIAEEITGLNIENDDKEILLWENVIRDGIAPRITIDCRIFSDEKVKVFLIRINKSWTKPHRVEYKNYHRFYARNSAGKYILDIDELRSSFLMTINTIQKIKNYIALRNEEILNGDSILPLGNKGKIALYIIPFDAFSYERQLSINEINKNLQPIYSSGWSSRINLNGHLNYSALNDNYYSSYVQKNRNGIIEAVNSSLLRNWKEEERFIPSAAYEKELLKSIQNYFAFLNELEINPPFIVNISFIDVKGYTLAVGNKSPFMDKIQINNEILYIPEIIINDYSTSYTEQIIEIFNSVWNAFGFEKTLNFDTEGNWIDR